MQSRPELPVYGRDEDRPIRRYHSASYYAHRVKESLTTRVSKLVCSIFLGLLAIVGLITFILWLSLRPHRPRIFLDDFSVPALGQGVGGPENAQINFKVTARNSNQGIGVYYDASQVTVYYQEQSIGGYQVLTPFYQQPKNSTIFASMLSGSSLTVTGSQWKQMQNDRTRGPVIFRLELTSTIRFKISSWNSKRHRMHANCPVGVGQDGMILPDYMDKRCPVYFS
ncbi:PREDICTED: NDR1/HIN1-like protein 12 [Nicotiana attenuata]|uniref:Ndr1hin1-like protein 12 n=1 Tax=Nicotiana attenuata TaxID=49451 RepID=A0A314L2C9_NICAT|nr:PREDICTED: NDR1/HIN1-like protein 12 [Nicotiana attenuata]OIT35703.1 ndr1hin1-like protein 12 [Nicotiana attenuata]